MFDSKWWLHIHYNKAKKRITELEEMLALKVEELAKKHPDIVAKILKESSSI